MKLSDDFEDQDNKSKAPLYAVMAAAIVFVIATVVIVIRINSVTSHYRKNSSAQAGADAQQAEETSASDLRAEDLDFWDMYKDGEKSVSDNHVIRDKSYEDRMKEMEEADAEKAKEEDLSEGGTKTKVTLPDGTEQWVMINAFLKTNSYKEEGFVYKNPMMKYYTEGKSESMQGLMLDESDGTVDFALLKEAGIKFVMLRYGYRGYETGELKKDECFEDNLTAAKGAGIQIGVYFESAATTEEEAIEEAKFTLLGLSQDPRATDMLNAQAATDGQTQQQTTEQTTTDTTQQTETQQDTSGETTTEGEGTDLTDQVIVEEIGEQIQPDATPQPEIEPETVAQQAANVTVAEIKKSSDITYPVAVKIGAPANHKSRTDTLPKSMLTLTANTYLKLIAEAGYKPMVWGDKYFLLRRLDLTRLDQGIEVSLEQSGEKPDYPYEFSLWQYQSDGKLSGKKEDAKMMISFVDYKSG